MAADLVAGAIVGIGGFALIVYAIVGALGGTKALLDWLWDREVEREAERLFRQSERDESAH